MIEKSLDLVIIGLIGAFFYTRISSWASAQLRTETAGSVVYDGLGVSYQDSMSQEAVQWQRYILSALILVVTFRSLELLLTYPKAGPLVIMLLRMGDDVFNFSLLCIFCVIGFALATVPLTVDPLNPFATPLHSTFEHLLGIIGEQDMDSISERTGTMGMYSLYLFAMQVILLVRVCRAFLTGCRAAATA